MWLLGIQVSFDLLLLPFGPIETVPDDETILNDLPPCLEDADLLGTRGTNGRDRTTGMGDRGD